MALAFNGKGGGGSAFDGGTITQALKIDATSNNALRVADATDTHVYLKVDTASGSLVLAANPTGNKSLVNLTQSALAFTDELGNTMLDIEGGYISLGSAGSVFITPSNYLAVSNHAAPADAELSAGDCALWFDQTNGAAKLMVKGKSADGTVVAASIALS